jgi:2'-5' RNA ligase
MKKHTHGGSSDQLSLFPEPKAQTQAAPEMDTVHQYFFIISPPDAIKSKVRSLKQKLNRAVGLSDYNLNSTPSISLMSFHTMYPVNDKFIQAVQELFSQINAFEVKLEGFEHFVHGGASDTIYAKLSDSEKITKLYKELHALLGLRVRSYVPHLTIARTVPRANFAKSFSIVKKQDFHEEFICDHVTILERKLHHGIVGSYQVFKEIKLAA